MLHKHENLSSSPASTETGGPRGQGIASLKKKKCGDQQSKMRNVNLWPPKARVPIIECAYTNKRKMPNTIKFIPKYFKQTSTFGVAPTWSSTPEL